MVDRKVVEAVGIKTKAAGGQEHTCVALVTRLTQGLGTRISLWGLGVKLMI